MIQTIFIHFLSLFRFLSRLTEELEKCEVRNIPGDGTEYNPSSGLGAGTEQDGNDKFVSCQIGVCFLESAEEMKSAYTEYCLLLERAESALEQYEADPTLQKVVGRGKH